MVLQLPRREMAKVRVFNKPFQLEQQVVEAEATLVCELEPIDAYAADTPLAVAPQWFQCTA